MKKEIDQSIKKNEEKEKEQQQQSTWKKIKKDSFSHNVATNKKSEHDPFDSLFGSDSDDE